MREFRGRGRDAARHHDARRQHVRVHDPAARGLQPGSGQPNYGVMSFFAPFGTTVYMMQPDGTATPCQTAGSAAYATQAVVAPSVVDFPPKAWLPRRPRCDGSGHVGLRQRAQVGQPRLQGAARAGAPPAPPPPPLRSRPAPPPPPPSMRLPRPTGTSAAARAERAPVGTAGQVPDARGGPQGARRREPVRPELGQDRARPA